jgi:hypothetical protein
MKITQDKSAPAIQVLRGVGRPGDTVPADGTYRCLCCGVMFWYLRRGKRFPDCESNNCPAMWMWSEP